MKTDDAKKREEKDNPESGAYLVCKGATCICSAGASGPVELQITSQRKVYVAENQPVATVKDNNMAVAALPFGTCALSPKKQAGQPCEYKPTSEWAWNSKVGDGHPEINGMKVLTENAVIKCPSYPGTISIFTHGQQVDVPDEMPGDMDDTTAMAIICLYEKVEEPGAKNVIPSVTAIKQGGHTSSGGKIVEVPLRVGAQAEFTAEYSEKTKKALYSYWFVRPRKEKETPPLKFAPSEGLLYRQTGNKIGLRIKEPGEYYIEGFGQLTYKGGGRKSKLYDNCTLLLKVQANRFKQITVTPSPVEQVDGSFEIWCGQPCLVHIGTLFALTEEEAKTVSVRIEDSAGNPIRRYSPGGDSPFLADGKCGIELMPLNEGIYRLSLSLLGEPEVNYTFAAIRNKLEKSITSDLPSSGKVRPGVKATFEATMKRPGIFGQLSWYIDNLVHPGKKGLVFEHAFMMLGKHNVHASLFQFLGWENKAGPYEVDVRHNSVESILSDMAGTEHPIGKTVKFTAETAFKEILPEKKEGVIWKISAVPPSTLGRWNEAIELMGSLKQDGQFPDGSPRYGTETGTGKDLEVKFNRLGEYEISANSGKTPPCPPKKVKIVCAHIEAWKFTDSQGSHRRHIGWGQAFYINLKVKGWERMKVSLQLWYDRGKGGIKDRFRKIKTAELENKQFEADGDGALKVKISPGSFWQSLDEVKDSNLLFKEDKPAFFFTAQVKGTLCDNWKQDTYDALGGHIFPQESRGTYAYVPLKTFYSGMFADAGGNTLKQIIQYEDTAKIVVWIENCKGDSFKKHKYKLYLVENTGKKDTLRTVSEHSFDDEGKIEYTLPMGDIHGTKPSSQPKHKPRMFYFELKQVVDGLLYGTNEKPVYLYPEGYGTGRRNDGNLISFGKDDYTEEYLEEMEEQFRQWYPNSSHNFMETMRRAWGGNVPEAQLREWEKHEAELRREAEESASEDRRKQAEALNEQAGETNAENLRRNPDYILQLKIAEEAGSENSRFSNTAKKIGQPLTYEKSHRVGDCYCHRDFTVDEIKSMVKAIKGKETIWEGGKGNGWSEKCAIDDKSFEGLTRELNKAFRKHGINTCIQKIAILAETSIETGFFACSEELESNHASSKYLYKGRGMIQLTGTKDGKGNDLPEIYATYKKECAIEEDIVKNPGLVGEKLRLAIDSGCWYFTDKKCPPWLHPTKKGSNETDEKFKKKQEAFKWKRKYFGEAASKQQNLNEIAKSMADDEEKYFFLISRLCHGYDPYQTDEKPASLNYDGRLSNLQKLKAWFKYDKDVCKNSVKFGPDGRALWMSLALEEAKNFGGHHEGSAPLRSRIKNQYFPAGNMSWELDPTSNGNAWCACFASYVMENAGYLERGNGTGRARSFSTGYDKNMLNMRKIENPVYGALVVLKKNGSTDSGHIAFLYGIDKNGKYLLLGGNQTNSLLINPRDKKGDHGYTVEGLYLPASYRDNPNDEFSPAELQYGSAAELNEKLLHKNIKINKEDEGKVL